MRWGVIAGPAAVVALVVLALLWLDADDHAAPVEVVGPRGRAQAGGATARDAGGGVDPFVDGAASAARVEAPPARRLGLDVVVLHPDGSPAAHAPVAVTKTTELVASGTTARDGRLRLADPPRFGPLAVWVAGVTYDVHHERFGDLDADELVVHLPDGAEIEGRLRVDGAAPRTEIPVAMRSSGPRRHLPPAVDEALRRELVGFGAPLVARGAPTVDGRFRITGIPAGLSARLTFPRVYRTVDGERVEVRPPAHGLVVDLATVPLVAGRLVDEGGAAVVGARAECWIFTGARWTHAYATSDDDGRVAFPLPTDASVADTVTIVARSRSRRLRVRATFEDVPTGEARDVGALVLRGGRHVDLLVLDEAGEPVSGAVARAVPAGVDVAATRHATTPLDDWLGVSRPTGRDGRTHLPSLQPGETRLEVVALGHAAVVVEAPPPDDALTVTLPRAARLDVHFDGEVPLGDLELWVSATADLCVSGPSPQPLRVALGAATPSRSRFFTSGSAHGPSFHEVTAQFPAAWRVIVDDVAPHERLEVSARLASGEVVWGPVEVELEPGEWRTLRARVRARPRTLRGRVVDTFGAPVVGAEVADVRRSGTAEDRTDAEGVFELHVVGPVVELSVSGDDFVPERLELAVADEPVEIVVDRGMTVVVHVVDATGRHGIFGADVVAVQPGRGIIARAEASRHGSHYRFEHLPVGTLEFVARIGGRRWSRRHHSASGDITLEVGDIGILQLKWIADVSLQMTTLRIDDAATGEPHEARPLTPEELRDREVMLPLPHGAHRVRVTRRAPGSADENAFAPLEAHVGPGVTRLLLEPDQD